MRLIDADALAKRMQYLIRLGYRDAFDCLDEIDAAPTIDATLVVRCKDCKFYRESQYFPNEKVCRLCSNFHSEDFFCASGERRKDETD